MKELSIEEKAKHYDEAIDVCRKLYNEAKANGYTSDIEDYETIFPELKESDDERIRKALISFLKSPFVNEYITDEKVNPWIAWLEKQGEQKPVDKVEPRFKVGDIIRHKEQGCTCKITAIDTATAEYGVSECNGTHLPFDFQDAWELVEQKPWSEEDENIVNLILCICSDFKRVYSQSETALKDTDKIESFLESLKYRIQSQPKQEWSEEDNEHIKSIISTIECSKAQFPNSPAVLKAYNSDLIWLKSLRPQMQWKAVDKEIYVKEPALAQRKDKSEPNHGYVICYDHTLTPDVYERFIMISDIYYQSHWKPTEEQITVINDTIRFIEDKSDSLSSDYLYNKMKELLEQLKAL